MRNQHPAWEDEVVQFDLVSLGSIALLALSLYEAYRCWDTTEMIPALVLLVVGAVQTAFVLQVMHPWGALNVSTWTTVLAAMMFSLSLAMLFMDLAGYTRSAVILILLISGAQLIVGTGIL